MMRKRSITTLATAAAVAAMTLTLTGTASADLTTRCVGEGGAVTIPTDLVVPNGQTCVLNGTVIQGDVRVGQGADLVTQNATIEGEVRVNQDGYLDTFETEVSDRVILRGAFGSFLATTTLGDDLVARPAGDTESAGFVATDDVDAAGSVQVTSGELLLDSSAIAGDVISRDSLYTDVYDTFIDGRLQSIANEQGSVVCASAIQGQARFIDNAFGVQLGGGIPLAECEGPSYWGSDVRAIGNTDGVYLDDNIVNGNVILRDNDPVAQVGDGNLVRGEVIGDFEPMPDSTTLSKGSAKSGVSPRAAEKVTNRDTVIDQKVDARRNAALDEAAATGPAF